MPLSASIFGKQHCRPVISIDGTNLKNKYSGSLLSASTSDANRRRPLFGFFSVVDHREASLEARGCPKPSIVRRLSSIGRQTFHRGLPLCVASPPSSRHRRRSSIVASLTHVASFAFR
ncbi:protein FAR1-RELATED SEQUENCE 3-like [Cucumis melo var. makuwa]|uniref:Protein FAR1-RELATED SEQUENCE 3-like n=1 Tax=Cucumis melo var. makuwa TaxID=1194695 RepID=A0A5A7TXY3_CUCMM|nr:protein FAR1-RELATED SEQUENCE 3-like [Cucumis melo var. makuwa]TYK04511.1 protein FAR1-RELATED SEQUENCE 3-like [Cucumis melo var. makuwa]